MEYEAPMVIRLGTVSTVIRGGEVMSQDVDAMTHLD